MVVEQVGGDQPDDLELETVGVLAVEALGGAVVGRTNQGAGSREGLLGPFELAERVDLPRQVVEADRVAAGTRRTGRGADREQAEIVVVRRPGRAGTPRR